MMLWNILDGRNNCIDAACRAASRGNVDVAILPETKFSADAVKYMGGRKYGYLLRSAPVRDGERKGGVTLIYRDSPLFQLENEKVQGPNVITFELVVGEGEQTERWFVVGAYIAPSERDGSTARRIEGLIASRPKDTRPRVLRP